MYIQGDAKFCQYGSHSCESKCKFAGFAPGLDDKQFAAPFPFKKTVAMDSIQAIEQTNTEAAICKL